jgi:hypothetical protein
VPRARGPRAGGRSPSRARPSAFEAFATVHGPVIWIFNPGPSHLQIQDQLYCTVVLKHFASVLVYRTDTTDVPTLHRSGSNPPALDTLPSSDRAGHGRRPAVSQPFGWEGNSGPFQEERQSAQGHQ